jgi:Domain of unknown function (DUF4157)
VLVRRRRPSGTTVSPGVSSAAAVTSTPASRSDVRHEQEADRVADAVARGPRAAHAPDTQRVPPPSGPSGGQPLDAGVRNVMEPRFVHDFRHVRVHTDRRAAELADGINARAFTVGPRMFFGAGAYAPGTTAGSRLLAHELAHVVQHDRGLVGPGRVLRQPKDAFARTDERPPPDPEALKRRRSVAPWPGISISWTYGLNSTGVVVPSVTIAARLQLFGPNASEEIAEAMKREVESFWTTSFPDGSQVHTAVNVSRRDDAAPPDPDAIQVRVISAPIRSFVKDTAGGVEMTYTVSSGPGTVSHEFAHLLGLDDRYSETWRSVVSDITFGAVAGATAPDPGYEANVLGIAGGVLESTNIRDLLIRHGPGSE